MWINTIPIQAGGLGSLFTEYETSWVLCLLNPLTKRGWVTVH